MNKQKRNVMFPKEESNVDSMIRMNLLEIGEMIEAEDSLKRSIDCRILEEEKERKIMKHVSVKKVVIGVVAASLLIGTVVIAGSGLKAIVGHAPAEPQYTDYADKDKVEAELGEKVEAVEKFENGAEFEGISTGEETAYNEAGEAVEKKKSLMMKYKHGDDTLDFSSTKLAEGDTEESVWEAQKGIDQTFEYKGVKLMYIQNRYICVKPDYVMTEQDLIDEENGDLSVGVDSIGGVDKQAYLMSWVLDGKQSSLFAFDISMTPEEIFEMAKEIIDIQLSQAEE